jgi:hypothetical protein
VERDLIREYISYVRVEKGLAKNSLAGYADEKRRKLRVTCLDWYNSGKGVLCGPSLVSFGSLSKMLYMDRLLSLAVILLIASMSPCAQESPKLHSEEYEIFSEVIRKTAILSDSRDVVVTNTTSRDGYFLSDVPKKHRELLPKNLHRSTLKNFIRSNVSHAELRDNFSDDLQVHFLSWEDFVQSMGKSSSDENDAVKFSAEYRLTFSRVGFNRQKTQALVFVIYQNNEVRRHWFGSYLLFERENSSWNLIQYARQ